MINSHQCVYLALFSSLVVCVCVCVERKRVYIENKTFVRLSFQCKIQMSHLISVVNTDGYGIKTQEYRPHLNEGDKNSAQ